MAASLDSVLTTAQNIVTAINGAAQTYLNVNGSANATAITAATVVKSSPGRVCTLSVIVAGSGAGKIYDSVSASATSAPLYTIPTTIGSYTVNMPAMYGIVVAPGTGQTVSVSYS